MAKSSGAANVAAMQLLKERAPDSELRELSERASEAESESAQTLQRLLVTVLFPECNELTRLVGS